MTLLNFFDSAAEKFDQEVPMTNAIRKLTVVELKKKFEDKGLSYVGRAGDLRKRAQQVDISITESGIKIIPGYINKPKGAL